LNNVLLTDEVKKKYKLSEFLYLILARASQNIFRVIIKYYKQKITTVIIGLDLILFSPNKL